MASSMRAKLVTRPFTSIRSCPRHWRSLHTNNRVFTVSEEVQQALHEKRPVVALETTIYTHGLPYPENTALASHLESVVRVNGGVPATIGIIDGVARVGLSAEEIIRLTESAGRHETIKISRRDLGYICGLGIAGKKLNGGTTIAGTMVLAHLAGIKVFATGGLGGVHRGGEASMDVSADLTELGRTPVAVISSGSKGFLDIPRTLEYLETQGVTVATFADGREGKVDFPAFWVRESGTPSPMVLADEVEAAAIIHAQAMLPLSSGLLFANPIPLEHSIAKSDIDAAISEAVEAANKHGASGKENTPFILNKIIELTKGASLAANRVLVEANVTRGTKVATELAKLEREASSIEQRESPLIFTKPNRNIESKQNFEPSQVLSRPVLDSLHSISPAPNPPASKESETDILVAGSLAIDLSCDYAPLQPQSGDISPHLHTSNPSIITQTLGGVGNNITAAAHLAGASVRLCSVIADDPSGHAALDLLKQRGIQSSGIKVLPRSSGQRTAQYIAINDMKKDLVLAMADMSILDTTSSSTDFAETWQRQLDLAKPKWLIADANWAPETLSAWISAAKASGAHVAFEPVSTAKSARLFARSLSNPLKTAIYPTPAIDLATPNAFELAAMHTAARDAEFFDRADWWAVIDAMGIPSSGARDRFVAVTNAEMVRQGVPQQALQLLPFMPCILTKLGAQGVLLTQLLHLGDERLRSRQHAPFIVARSLDEDDERGVGGVYMRLFAPAETVDEKDVVSVNGVGDTFLGVLVAGLVKSGAGMAHLETLVEVAQRGSVLSLKSREAVSLRIGELRSLLER
ncbi:MAG: hypothetical protein M1819_002463 [Sarea resinae]|nr:MAG: hypothetical protein M1819_002463 [Sarea resinae]